MAAVTPPRHRISSVTCEECYLSNTSESDQEVEFPGRWRNAPSNGHKTSNANRMVEVSHGTAKTCIQDAKFVQRAKTSAPLYVSSSPTQAGAALARAALQEYQTRPQPSPKRQSSGSPILTPLHRIEMQKDSTTVEPQRTIHSNARPAWQEHPARPRSSPKRPQPSPKRQPSFSPMVAPLHKDGMQKANITAEPQRTIQASQTPPQKASKHPDEMDDQINIDEALLDQHFQDFSLSKVTKVNAEGNCNNESKENLASMMSNMEENLNSHHKVNVLNAELELTRKRLSEQEEYNLQLQTEVIRLNLQPSGLASVTTVSGSVSSYDVWRATKEAQKVLALQKRGDVLDEQVDSYIKILAEKDRAIAELESSAKDREQELLSLRRIQDELSAKLNEAETMIIDKDEKLRNIDHEKLSFHESQMEAKDLIIQALQMRLDALTSPPSGGADVGIQTFEDEHGVLQIVSHFKYQASEIEALRTQIYEMMVARDDASNQLEILQSESEHIFLGASIVENKVKILENLLADIRVHMSSKLTHFQTSNRKLMADWRVALDFSGTQNFGSLQSNDSDLYMSLPKYGSANEHLLSGAAFLTPLHQIGKIDQPIDKACKILRWKQTASNTALPHVDPNLKEQQYGPMSYPESSLNQDSSSQGLKQELTQMKKTVESLQSIWRRSTANDDLEFQAEPTNIISHTHQQMIQSHKTFQSDEKGPDVDSTKSPVVTSDREKSATPEHAHLLHPKEVRFADEDFLFEQASYNPTAYKWISLRADKKTSLGPEEMNAIAESKLQGQHNYRVSDSYQDDLSWASDREEIKLPQNGLAMTALPDGNQYIGEWADFAPHGNGIFQWSNGDVYTGQWIRGIRHGRGILATLDNQLYQGEWVDDKKHGMGVEATNDGKYCGSWLAGFRNGIGTATTVNLERRFVEFSTGTEIRNTSFPSASPSDAESVKSVQRNATIEAKGAMEEANITQAVCSRLVFDQG